MQDLIIIGAGGFGREVLQWAKHVNNAEQRWKIKGFIDDNLQALEGIECDYQVLGAIQSWRVSPNEVFVCAIAKPALKQSITTSLLARGAVFANLVHPTAIIGDFCKIGKGLIVTPNAKVSPNVTIGDFVTLLGSGVGHDAVLEDFCTISGNCSINGNVRVKQGAFVASNTCVVPGKTIGQWAYVGMGSMVIRSVEDHSKVFGNPAKKLKF
ncbi:MAG: acetyltransferase [Lewinella sp.]|uniref:acetyltransferase n=1 Tax=Lewinella sp. TaxID=2004506 RepID=UPI003D6BD5AA